MTAVSDEAVGRTAIFVVGLLCSLGAGALLQAFAWQTLNLLLPWLAAAALALIGLVVSRRQSGNKATATT